MTAWPTFNFDPSGTDLRRPQNSCPSVIGLGSPVFLSTVGIMIGPAEQYLFF
jgi:hypothetical protein